MSCKDPAVTNDKSNEFAVASLIGNGNHDTEDELEWYDAPSQVMSTKEASEVQEEMTQGSGSASDTDKENGKCKISSSSKDNPLLDRLLDTNCDDVIVNHTMCLNGTKVPDGQDGAETVKSSNCMTEEEDEQSFINCLVEEIHGESPSAVSRSRCSSESQENGDDVSASDVENDDNQDGRSEDGPEEELEEDPKDEPEEEVEDEPTTSTSKRKSSTSGKGKGKKLKKVKQEKGSPKKSKSSLLRKNIKMVDDDELDEEVSRKRKEEEERIQRQKETMEKMKEQLKKMKDEKQSSQSSPLKPVVEICLSSDDEDTPNGTFDPTSTGHSFGKFPTTLSNRDNSILNQFGVGRYFPGRSSSGQPALAHPFGDQARKKSIIEARDEIIELGDEEEDAKWRYGTEHQYTDDDLAEDFNGNVEEEDDDDGEDDLDEEGNPCGLFADDRLNKRDQDGLVLINVGHPPTENPIYLPPQIAEVIKPHQIGGIRFMYANVIESLDKFKKTDGVGCILAHAMGLGKTIQIAAFTHVFLTHTTGKRVLIIVPINTLQNWVAEFNQWTPAQPKMTDVFDKVKDTTSEQGSKMGNRKNIKYRTYKIYEMSDSKNLETRAAIVSSWQTTGGVLLLGYEMYRILIDKSTWSKLSKKHSLDAIGNMVKDIRQSLVNPGPDLVVCDEGHRIKNDASKVSEALKEIRTKRRIVLTGYPLQNNLIEYWCMVDFVRPGYLGTKEEFANRFEKPIKNGQFVDSIQSDKIIMRRRAFVLADLLKGFVQRRSHDILYRTLPMKHELVLLIRMTDIQKRLFQALFCHFKSQRQKLNPITLFSICNKIWNHPDILHSVVTDGIPIDDFDDDPTFGPIAGNRAKGSGKKPKATTASFENPSSSGQGVVGILNGLTVNPRALDLSWSQPVFEDYVPNVIENSHKMVVLLELIDRTVERGEKILVFSQSLLTLNIIENYLSKRRVPNKKQDEWIKGLNYYRIDGSTNSMDRDLYINSFNKNPKFKLFLLSTRAGCLGINLVGASRIVIFDVSWNPCHDAQAACRIYRYGQVNETYIYRLVADNSLEKKVFDRCISKQGMSNRVIDEENPETILQAAQVMSLVDGLDKVEEQEVREFDQELISQYNDEVVQTICQKLNHVFTKEPFKHESLLLHDRKTALSKRDKITAKKQYQDEKNAKTYGSGRNNWINGPPVTSFLPGIDYKPIEVFRPLSEGQPKWPEVKPKLVAKGFAFLKRSQMPMQLRLQDRVTGAPNYINVGEEVDFYRNNQMETILVTKDCKVIEVVGTLLTQLNVDALARSNTMYPQSIPQHSSTSLLPDQTYRSLLPSPGPSQQLPRRILPETSLHRYIKGSSTIRTIPSNPSAAIATMFNPSASVQSSVGPHYRPILPTILRPPTVSRTPSPPLSQYFVKKI